MISRWIRAAALLALAPASALAFETIDALPWPSGGLFAPGYTGDPLRPWSITAYGGTMYDTNVQRTSTDETADFISRVGVGGRYAARVVGRQSIALDGFGEYRSYDELSEYNHFAYGLRGAWLWELGNQLSGVATAERVHRLGDIGESLSRVKDMVTLDRLEVTGAYRFHPDWRLTGGVASTRVAHDGRSLDTAHSVGTRAGILYVSPLGNSVGIEVRHREGDAPVDESLGIGAFPNNEYEEDEVALTLTYALGTQLRLRGRIGHTERTYTEVTGNDFSGATGRGTIEWLPGAKTRFTFEAYREADPLIDIDALYADLRGVAFGAAWAPTYKVVLSMRAVNERRIYKGDPRVQLAGVLLRDETLRLLRFGLGWEPERRWQFGSSVDFGARESNSLGRDYDYTAIALNLRYSF
jgi:hypothetical protein